MKTLTKDEYKEIFSISSCSSPSRHMFIPQIVLNGLSFVLSIRIGYEDFIYASGNVCGFHDALEPHMIVSVEIKEMNTNARIANDFVSRIDDDSGWTTDYISKICSGFISTWHSVERKGLITSNGGMIFCIDGKLEVLNEHI